MKRVQKDKARELRKNGESIKVIAKTLGVSKSSVSLWTRDIQLTSKQYKELYKRIKSNWIYRGKQSREISLEKRKKSQKEGRLLAKENDALYAIGCVLYWAEGNRKNNKNMVKISNSDPYLLKLFLKFLKKYFKVMDDKIFLYLNHYTDIVSVEEAEEYWLKKLNLPKECMKKTIVNNLSKYTNKKRCGSLKYGTCALIVHDTEILQKIYGGIQKYGKFNRKAWLLGSDDRIE